MVIFQINKVEKTALFAVWLNSEWGDTGSVGVFGSGPKSGSVFWGLTPLTVVFYARVELVWFSLQKMHYKVFLGNPLVFEKRLGE